MTQSEERTSERERIDVDIPGDVEKWSEAFGVSIPQLISAIAAVGDRPTRVQSYLQALA
ncbi:DUF3606 domain-containing protein [Rhizobacter sp. Root404]|uniref:DUF3606 domain-containing protein n=1 Tax=Rhizobacter sp. Root404 TaxID=1736528 RepID=UPI000AE10E01